ncbi:MAG: DUF1553 domain-containing protein [Pedosphaera sp.]|nr:DUF1553 domain-containing protein [Pedosphaera sp.]MST00752.1 DUF1553 domain-containing protein [Pedosphaera sp.]
MNQSLTFALAAAGMLLASPSRAAVGFARDIQPLFAKHCYSCHGPEKQKSGLRLDIKAAAFAGGDSGKVIVPGKSGESRLVKFISGVDKENVMPPKGERLSTAQIVLIKEWIDAGAVWPDGASASGATKSTHWSFQPIQRPVAPRIQNPKMIVRNPIDAFVLARLEKEKLAPSLEADRHTLIRRLSLDLIGLLPKPEEVTGFVNDSRPDAYERLVDRLLASPHFGERWGRHWLDLARYADSDGYEKDRPRPFAYLYRDWVINAINRDLPFDRFSIEQLAGDLLPDATHEQHVATGFHRQTLTNTEGGVDQEEFRGKATVDRVNTTSTTWLGLTAGCAECHSHKYDPLTQREYYQLFAFFNNASEKNLPAMQAAELTTYNKLKGAWETDRSKLKSALDSYVTNDLPRKQVEWEKQAQPSARWTVLETKKFAASDGVELKAQPDKSILASGPNPATATYTVEATTDLKTVTGFRLEALVGVTASKNVGRSKNGNFVLSEFSIKIADATGEKPIALHNAAADFHQERSGKNYPAAGAIDGDIKTGWAVMPQTNRTHTIVFQTREPFTPSDGARILITLDQQHGTEHTLAQFRLAATSDAGPLRPDSLPDLIAQALRTPTAQRKPEQTQALAKHFRETVDSGVTKFQTQIDEHAKKQPKPPETFAATLVAEPKGRETRIHIRGNFLNKGDAAQPGTPAVLHPFKPRGERADRLDLARWLFDPANPLTARVTVNHVWKTLFGRGFVATVDDFGARGEKPSHPELLDWLASTFASSASSQTSSPHQSPGLSWSRKALIKLIVTSTTYRQESRVRPELAQRDPNNLLLARQNRLRLEAEAVRDSYLAVSGLLNPTIGGPSIRPALPADIAALGYANSVKWTESPGNEKHRRGLYIFFQRTVPYPMLMTFDAPDSNAVCSRRERSNTPLQALALLNDGTFFECAQTLGKAIHAEASGSVEEKLKRIFQRCLARPPTSAELTRLTQLYAAQLQLVQANPDTAAKICGAEKKDQPGLAEQATLTMLSRVLLNLDEFITRE